MQKFKWIMVGLFCFLFTSAFAESFSVKIYETAKKGQGKFLGVVLGVDTAHGLLLTPNLQGLPPGLHGFHVHQNSSCEDNGMAAGGHFDPSQSDKHLGPYNKDGHLGDLPALYVDPKGNATLPILAPRLVADDLVGHTLMIHAGGDNYSDHPEKLGGGGARIACGIISQLK